MKGRMAAWFYQNDELWEPHNLLRSAIEGHTGKCLQFILNCSKTVKRCIIQLNSIQSLQQQLGIEQ